MGKIMKEIGQNLESLTKSFFEGIGEGLQVKPAKKKPIKRRVRKVRK